MTLSTICRYGKYLLDFSFLSFLFIRVTTIPDVHGGPFHRTSGPMKRRECLPERLDRTVSLSPPPPPHPPQKYKLSEIKF